MCRCLLQDLVATGKPVVLLNFSGRATVKWKRPCAGYHERVVRWQQDGRCSG